MFASVGVVVDLHITPELLVSLSLSSKSRSAVVLLRSSRSPFSSPMSLLVLHLASPLLSSSEPASTRRRLNASSSHARSAHRAFNPPTLHPPRAAISSLLSSSLPLSSLFPLRIAPRRNAKPAPRNIGIFARAASVKSVIPAHGYDYYELLGLHPSASSDEIKSSYRKLQKRCHPDVAGMHHATFLIPIGSRLVDQWRRTLRRLSNQISGPNDDWPSVKWRMLGLQTSSSEILLLLPV